jgi:hypothetical protein
MDVKRRLWSLVGTALLIVGLLAALSPAGATAGSRHAKFDWRVYLSQHGYLPLRGVETLEKAKAHAAAMAATLPRTAPSPTALQAPTLGTSWQGTNDTRFTPPDANGAIGPNSYLEIVNSKIAIYTRAGAETTSALLSALTGDANQLSDPTILWDPDTQRFYYNVWDINTATMRWGFSKNDNPTTIPGSFCNYNASFGYTPSNAPDYPKLGQSKGFLDIGVNFYPTFSSQHATRSDLLWISKPQGSGSITTCPASSTFKTGKFMDLRNEDGSQAFTPEPAAQTDPSKVGLVVASTDIECPDICGSGMQISVYQLKPKASDPTVPKLTKPQSITVSAFSSPPDAPQQGSAFMIDTLDGRLMRAVSGIDPTLGTTAIWVAHAVLGGAGSQVNWYEINSVPAKNPTIAQSGVVKKASLYVYDPGISPDRTVKPSGAAHGSAMVLGFTTSSSSAFTAAQMVSKVGAAAQSGFVMVHASTVPDTNFGCVQLGYCRWGDYGGASADPASSLGGATGDVWLSNQYTTGTADATWNWQAHP